LGMGINALVDLLLRVALKQMIIETNFFYIDKILKGCKMTKQDKEFSRKRKKNVLVRKQDSKNSINKSDEKMNSSNESAEPATKRITRSFVIELVTSVILIAAICALRTVHLYANNVDEVTFAELGGTMWIFMGAGVGVFLILRIFLRKPYFATIFVAFGVLMAVNFSWLVDFMRLFITKYNPASIGGLVLYIVLVAGIFFLLRFLFKKKIPFHIITRILALTFAGLVLFNTVLALVAVGNLEPDDIAEQQAAVATPVATLPPIEETTPKPTETASDGETTPAPTDEPFGQPNIYFFILDEYGTFDIMAEYYGYNNAVFYEFLKTNGFNISRESYVTDTQTEQSMCDMLSLEYISRHFTKSESISNIANARMFSLLTELGYSQFQYSTHNKEFNSIVSLNSEAGSAAIEEIANMFGDEEADEIISESSITDAFSELFSGGDVDSIMHEDPDGINEWGFYTSEVIRETKGFKNHDYSRYINVMLSIFDYFEDPSNYNPTTPRVTYSYMSATHVPFVFNEYGSILPESRSRDWEDTDVYLGQYKFITKHMMASIATILENDPDSIIIVMSDHGIRYHADCNRKHTFYITDKDSLRIINAVYIKGEQYDIEGLSGINTLRFVLSLFDGVDLPPIEDPITSDSPDSLRGIIPKPR
jgi:hypothetical protein